MDMRGDEFEEENRSNAKVIEAYIMEPMVREFVTMLTT
jgi:hypothetical protein